MFECEAQSLKVAVEMAIKAGADIQSADLRYANLHSANLRSADLCNANLHSANLSYADIRDADLSYADLSSADLISADLISTDLRSANLNYADLSSANIDYSSWPLWCGTKSVKVDVNIAAQLAAHFCALDCEDKNFLKAKKAILKFAKTSHRAKDLGLFDKGAK